MTFGSKMSHPSSKTRISALEKLKRSNAAKLELETRKMEERIRSLKEKMMKEKEERERLGGSRWTSGRTGPLTKTRAQKSPSSKISLADGTVNKVPRRIKVLTDEPVDHYMQKRQPIAANENANLCGQCERNVSAWICHECSEKYCDNCFDQFHSRGALRKHSKSRVEAETISETGIQVNSPVSAREDKSFLRQNVATLDTRTYVGNDHMNGPSLLNGSYDEDESAASFAQALQEWRNQNQDAKISRKKHPVSTDTSCGTSNESITGQDDKKELMITFNNSSMSYGDRLYLKKNRENRLPSLDSTGKLTTKSEKKVLSRASKHDIDIDVEPEVEREEKENHKPIYPFTPNYREMIQNIAGVRSNPDISGSFHEDAPPRRAISVQEVSPVDVGIHDDQATACIVEECEETATDEARPASRHGAVTICEMYSSGDFSEQTSTKDFGQSRNVTEAHNYVSPSITSKPFFLKPSGKVTVKKQPERMASAGRKKASNIDEKREILSNKEYQRLSAKGRQFNVDINQALDRKASSSQKRRDKTSKQLPLKKSIEKLETFSNTTHQSPKSSSNKDETKNKTRIPIRQAWKPKPTHKELSEFFLAGVDENGENSKQNEAAPVERSYSVPITNLGRGCLSSTWNPRESYLQIPPDSCTDVSKMKISTTPEKDHLQTSASEKRDSGKVAEIDDSSDDLKLTSYEFEELKKGARKPAQNKVSGENNSSNEEDELLALTELDDFGTGDQDDDDLATLNDLAWELTSSTGRLTRCEDDFYLESDDDSIEDKDGGSGLTTPCTFEKSSTFEESIMDDFEEMEKKFMEEEF